MNYLTITNSAIIVAPKEPTWVQKAVQDLQEYVQCISHRRPDVVEPGSVPSDGLLIIVGYAAARQFGLDSELPSSLGDQGFVLKTISLQGRAAVIAAGRGSKGSAYAVIDLIRLVKAFEEDAVIPGQLDILEKPHFEIRGMYAHQHWAYGYPYALRTWGLEDWKRYVDLLSHLKINFFQIWSMVGICPVPLSDGDREYLERYPKIIDYAKNVRGMEVWIGEAANNVAESDCGQPIARREYFQVEVLKDPSDAVQLAELLRNRHTLYSIADNADGYWIIDSDPGGWPGSPAERFVDILACNRELIDRCGRSDAKLAYWMWVGWGNGRAEENWRDVLMGMRHRVHEPWWLLACWEGHLMEAARQDRLPQTVFFPYGVVESEPSAPITRVRFGEMAAQLDMASAFPGLAGVMGNAQSPIVQLPNIYNLAECAWSGNTRKSSAQRLKELGRLVAPEAEEELGHGWLLVEQGTAKQRFSAASKLQKLVGTGRIGRPGPLGRYVLPDHNALLYDLHLQLRMHAWANDLTDNLKGAAPPELVQRLLVSYHNAALRWCDKHGYRGRNLFHGSAIEQIPKAWQDYQRKQDVSKIEVKEVIAALRKEGHEQALIEESLRQTPIGASRRQPGSKQALAARRKAGGKRNCDSLQ